MLKTDVRFPTNPTANPKVAQCTKSHQPVLYYK